MKKIQFRQNCFTEKGVFIFQLYRKMAICCFISKKFNKLFFKLDSLLAWAGVRKRRKKRNYKWGRVTEIPSRVTPGGETRRETCKFRRIGPVTSAAEIWYRKAMVATSALRLHRVHAYIVLLCLKTRWNKNWRNEFKSLRSKWGERWVARFV
jgi:hypothetical protein